MPPRFCASQIPKPKTTLPPLALTEGEKQFIFPIRKTATSAAYFVVELTAVTGEAPDSVTLKI